MVTNLEFELDLEPVGYSDRWPNIYVKVDDITVNELVLTEPKTLAFDLDLQRGAHRLILGLTNKTDEDTKVLDGKIIKDMAVIVRGIGIETYRLEDFLHRATYYPMGRDTLKSNYLGWNGEWILDIETPIFTWIHETQQLGWIYGKNV